MSLWLATLLAVCVGVIVLAPLYWAGKLIRKASHKSYYSDRIVGIVGVVLGLAIFYVPVMTGIALIFWRYQVLSN